MAQDLQLNISYDLGGRDPKEVEKLIKKTMKELAKSGALDPNAYKVLPQTTAEEWDLELTTGNETPGCPVALHVCGVKGDNTPILLSRNADGDVAFMPGTTDKFKVVISDDIGDVFKLRFGFPDEVKEASWHLKKIKLQHPIDKDTYSDEPNLELKKSAGLDPWQEIPVVWPDYPKLQVVNYQVYTTTSIKSGRMECGAFIILYGEYGNTGKRALKKSLNSKVKFQPGQNDRFEIPAVKLGEIRKVWIANDLSANNKNWMLDKVVVKESTASDREWVFKCKRYFDPNKGDRKHERILELGKEPDPEPGEDDPRPKSPPKPPPKAKPPPAPVRDPSPPSPPPAPKKEKKKKEEPPPPPPPPPPEPEPEPEPAPKPKVKKKKNEEPPPPPPPEPKKEKPKTKEEPKPKEKPPPVEEAPPPEAAPQPDAPNDEWQIWWQNFDEQERYENATITFTLVGDRGESSEELSLEDVNLAKGESRKYDFEQEPDEIGELLKVRLRLGDEVKKKTKWNIAKLFIKHNRSGDIHVFEFQKPVIKKEFDTATEASTEKIPVRTYIVMLYTGSRPGLSGHSRAYIIVRGENGDTGKRWIVNPSEGKQLKKGEIMKMEIDSVDLGAIQGIRLGHDDAGKSPSYFLEKVTVRPSHRADLQYVFTFDDDTRNGEATAQEEEQKGVQYDPKEWQMSWTNEENQPHDFLQIAAILFGEKGQSTSYFFDVELKPGDSDGYLIRVEQDIGELVKCRMSNGPKVKGKHPWFIKELRLKNLATGKMYTFQLGGGAGGGDSGMRKYKVEVYYTPKGVQTIGDARLNIKIFGEKHTTERMQLDSKGARENQSPFDSFDLDLADLGEVKNLRLGHNKKNKQIGFFVSKVIVKPLHLPNKEWVFNIPYVEEEEKDVPESEWLISWNCSDSQRQVMTTIVLVLYGEDAKKTPEISVQTMLRPGQSEETMYMMQKPREFKPYKVRVGFWEKQYEHINLMLKFVKIRCVRTRTIYTFTCNGMVMFNDERDGWREVAIDVPPDQRRPPLVTYELQVFTSKEVGTVTDSKIYVMINGKQGDTGKRKLLRSLNNGFKNFIPGRMDTFRIEAVDLDEIESIVVGHNDQGRYPSWHCERILITDRHGGQVYEFDMNKWFDKKRADMKIEREFPVTNIQRAGLGRKWFVKIKTGNHPRAGTKTPLGLIICGTENTSDIVLMGKSLGVDGFKPNETYEFNVEIDLDDIEDVVGEVFKIRLGFLDWNQWPSVYIEEVFLEELVSSNQYYVDVKEWIWSSPRHDGWREFQVRGPSQDIGVYKYQLAVWTGTAVQANTTADIYCQIFGSKGDTGKRRLCNSKSHVRPFQLGQMDLFDIEAVDLGDIKKITLMMIAEEAKDNWHCVKMSLQQHPFNGEEFQFDTNRWFDSASHTQTFTPSARNDGKPYAGPPGEHLCLVTTGPAKDSTTTSNISLMIYGEKGMAGPFALEHPPVLGPDGLPIPVNPKAKPFQAGSVDFFPFTINEDQVGRIMKARISIDNKGKLPRWFLEKLAIQNLHKSRLDTYHFVVNDWLADDKGDGELTREFAAEYPSEDPLQSIRYKIEIGIGPKNSATVPHDVDCTVTLYGPGRYNSGPRRLKKNADSNRIFQAGKINTFYIRAVGVGDVTKVCIGHTCPDARFKFHVRDVTVSWDPNNKLTFRCDEVIVKTKPTIPAEVTLVPK